MKKIYTLLFCLFLSIKTFSVVPGYQLQYSSATSGTVTVNDIAQDIHLVHDAGTTATLTIALPANPYENQRVLISSEGGITALTISVTAPITVNNTVTSLAAGTSASYVYSQVKTKWEKF